MSSSYMTHISIMGLDTLHQAVPFSFQKYYVSSAFLSIQIMWVVLSVSIK